MAREDSCHGDSGDGEGGLFDRRAAAACGGLQARQPESASAVACGGAGWDEPGRCRADRRSLTERIAIPSTVPRVFPTWMYSPIRNASSDRKNTPEMMSRTRVWEPKPSAIPITPQAMVTYCPYHWQPQADLSWVETKSRSFRLRTTSAVRSAAEHRPKRRLP